MIVVDSSVLFDVLIESPSGPAMVDRVFAGNESLHAPHLIDLEIAHVLRRYVNRRELSPTNGERALRDLANLPITRYPHIPWLDRIWELRHNLSAYDAAYVALAETLDAPLLTRDAALSSSSGHRAHIELV